MRQRNLYYNLFLSVLFVSILASCAKDNSQFGTLTNAKQEANDVAIDWMHLSLELTKDAPGFTAPVATRAYAYIGLGMYEAALPGLEGQGSFQGKLMGLEKSSLPKLEENGTMNWSVSINECMYYLFTRIYRNSSPKNLAKIEESYHSHLTIMEPRLAQDVIDKSKQFGKKIGEAIYAYSLEDGQDGAFLTNYPSNYSAPSGAGLWNPNSAEIKKPLQPYWGKVRMFIPFSTGSQVTAPPTFSTQKNSEFYSYALEVHNRVRNLDFEQVRVVEYWNDDQDGEISTSGHMITIALQLLEEEKKDLAFAVTTLAKLGIAMHDATVCAWKLKYEVNLVRPESYIKENIDADFLTLINTPATPEYSCSQSAVASVATEVLSSIWGYSYAFTDRTQQYRKDIKGDPRSYKNFQQMADEISNANLAAGIHYRFSLDAGAAQGNLIAQSLRGLRI